jgi:hypothetical protein
LAIQDIDNLFHIGFWDNSDEPFAATSKFIPGDSFDSALTLIGLDVVTN